MRTTIWIALAGLAVIALLAAGRLMHKGPASLDRLADRIEQLDAIPDETRAELTRLIERTTRDAKGTKTASTHDRNNAEAAARIERALQFKPSGRGPVQALKN